MVSFPKFEHSALEKDLSRLAVEVQSRRENSELKHLGDEDLLKRSIKEYAPHAGALSDDGADDTQLPAYLSNASPEMKLEVEYLLDTAFHHGLGKANKLAIQASPFVMDAFHDALTGILYPQLKERGMLK